MLKMLSPLQVIISKVGFLLALIFALSLVMSGPVQGSEAEPLSPAKERPLHSGEWGGDATGIFVKSPEDSWPVYVPVKITVQRFRKDPINADRTDPKAGLFQLYTVTSDEGVPSFSFSLCTAGWASERFVQMGITNSSLGRSYLWWLSTGGRLYLCPLVKSNDPEDVIQRYLESNPDDPSPMRETEARVPASFGLACPVEVIDLCGIFEVTPGRYEEKTVHLSPAYGTPVVRVDSILGSDARPVLRLYSSGAIFVIDRSEGKWDLLMEGKVWLAPSSWRTPGWKPPAPRDDGNDTEY